MKKVINLDHGGAKHVMCAWDDCERDGYENNKVVIRDNAPSHPDKTITYVFCSERHRNYFIDSTRGVPAGYLRAGNRGGILLETGHPRPRTPGPIPYTSWVVQGIWIGGLCIRRNKRGIRQARSPYLGVRAHYGHPLATPAIPPCCVV